MGTQTSCRVIAVANLKGGVAKTTTTINLGAALVERGNCVLLVDLDAQQDLCAALRVRIRRPGLADVLLSAAYFESADLSVAFAESDDLFVVGGYGLDKAERELVLNRGWEQALKRALDPQRHRFDYILLDCAPAGNSMMTNALAAADEVLVPIQTEFLAANHLPGIMSAVDDIRSRQINPELRVAGFLPTMYDSRTRHALRVMEHIATQAHSWGVRAFRPIPRVVRLAEAAEAGTPINRFDAESVATVAYQTLADAIDGYRTTSDNFTLLSESAMENSSQRNPV